MSASSPTNFVTRYRANLGRKYDQSNIFGIVASASSNAIWTPDENAPGSAVRSAGGGRAIVGADEEVLCWDVKKSELLSRWRVSENSAEVTTIARSSVDVDVYAVG